jgi:hypothetical protein
MKQVSSSHLLHVGLLSMDYTVLYPRRKNNFFLSMFGFLYCGNLFVKLTNDHGIPSQNLFHNTVSPTTCFSQIDHQQVVVISTLI